MTNFSFSVERIVHKLQVHDQLALKKKSTRSTSLSDIHDQLHFQTCSSPQGGLQISSDHDTATNAVQYHGEVHGPWTRFYLPGQPSWLGDHSGFPELRNGQARGGGSAPDADTAAASPSLSTSATSPRSSSDEATSGPLRRPPKSSPGS